MIVERDMPMVPAVDDSAPAGGPTRATIITALDHIDLAGDTQLAGEDEAENGGLHRATGDGPQPVGVSSPAARTAPPSGDGATGSANSHADSEHSRDDSEHSRGDTNGRRLNVLIGVVVTAGAAAMLHAVAAAGAAWGSRPETWQLVAGFALFTVAECGIFHLRFGTDRRTFTWSEAAIVVGLVLLPHPWLCLVAPVAVGLAHVLARRGPLKVAFNVAVTASGVLVARAVHDLTATDVYRYNSPRVWAALALASLVFYLWQTGLVTAAVALSQGLPLRRVHERGLMMNVTVWAGNTATGIIVLAAVAHGAMLVLVLPVQIAALSLVYRAYLRASQERDLWRLLEATSRELLVADRDDLAAVAVARAATALGADVIELVIIDQDDAAVLWRGNQTGVVERRIGLAPDLAPAWWGRLAWEREPFGLDAASAPTRARGELRSAGLASAHIAPLMARGRCLGGMAAGFARGTIGARERQVFTTLTNHVAAAIDNSSLMDELRHQALHDPLTGLPNRTLLRDRLEHALDRISRASGQVAVLFFDLDRFKVINDSLGHEIGDHLVAAAADRITGLLRPGDTATRFGGDEFVVVCEDVAGEDQALEIAGRLVTELGRPFMLAGHEVVVSASVGVAVSRPGVSAATLLRDADAAMYQAKARGGGRAELSDADIRMRAATRLAAETELRHGIEQHQLAVHYQPVIDLETSQVVGLEALVRWQHPTRGLLMPGSFVPLAEEAGLIQRLGAFVLQEACIQLAIWRQLPGNENLTMAVNLSAVELARPELLQEVSALLALTRIPPEALCVEVTESALLPTAALEALAALHELGVTIAVDDFGTGYSSFSYLHTLPITAVKIDRSFVARMGQDPRDRALLAGMVDLAHALDLSVVAEGVESSQTLEALASIGCDQAQGYHVAPPRPAESVTSMLRPPAAPELSLLTHPADLRAG